jgi:hypothetical protein
MPFVPGFLTAASFYLHLSAAYFVPDCLGTILTGFTDHHFFDNPLLFTNERLFADFPNLRHGLGISVSVADRPIDGPSLHNDPFIMQLHGLLHRFSTIRP